MKQWNYFQRWWQDPIGVTVASCKVAGSLLDRHSGTKKNSVYLVSLLSILALLLVIPLTLEEHSVRLRTGDGVSRPHSTRADTVGQFLAEKQIELQPGDVVVPGIDSKISDDLTIEVDPARNFVITVGDDTYKFRSAARTAQEALEVAGLSWSPNDYLSVNGKEVRLAEVLPSSRTQKAAAVRDGSSRSSVRGTDIPALSVRSSLSALIAAGRPQGGGDTSAPSEISMELKRAKHINILDDTNYYTIYSTADSVGRALYEEDIPVYLYDRVKPGTDSELVDNMVLVIDRAHKVTVTDENSRISEYVYGKTVADALGGLNIQIGPDDAVTPALSDPITDVIQIRRAKPVTLVADGKESQLKSPARNVAELLQENGIVLGEKDLVEPPPDTALAADMKVTVTRVEEKFVRVEEDIPFNVTTKQDASMFAGTVRTEGGAVGGKEVFYRVTIHDGNEVNREFVDDYIFRQPVDQIKYLGTKPRPAPSADVPAGPVEGGRTLYVLATSYYPSSCGKSPSDPSYGITATGKRATRGIVAVDPRVIPLHTRMYIPGYGYGVAEDTGGMIKGYHIDLCFDDADRGQNLWGKRWVTITILD